MVLKQIAAVAVAAISMLAQRESEGPQGSEIGRWVCRLVPVFVVISVLRRTIRIVIRIIRRCQRVPFFGWLCWITGIQFLIIVTWTIVRIVLVYWKWVCNWVPRPPQRGEDLQQQQE